MKKKKGLKITLIVLVALLVILFGVGCYVGNFFYDLALNPHSDKSTVLGAEQNQIDYTIPEDPEVLKKAQELEDWFNNGHTDKYITSYDNLKLHGYMVKQETPTNKWALVFHGYNGNAPQMKGSAKRFFDQGYNVLLPDARSAGESEGDYIGMGWHERKDAVQWIEQIVAADSQAQIALYGVSMGGATVMMISGEDLPANVKVIVEDCGYSSVWDEFAHQLQGVFNMPTFPIMNFASLVTNVRAGYTLEEASAVDQLKKAKTPIMFIHGTEDTFVPYSMLDVVYDAADVPKEKLVAEGAGHGQAASVLGEEYWEKVFAFVGQYVAE